MIPLNTDGICTILRFLDIIVHPDGIDLNVFFLLQAVDQLYAFLMAHRIQRCGKDVRYAAVVCDYRNRTAVPSRHQCIRVNDMMHDLTLIRIIALVITAGHKGCVALGFYRD